MATQLDGARTERELGFLPGVDTTEAFFAPLPPAELDSWEGERKGDSPLEGLTSTSAWSFEALQIQLDGENDGD